MKHILLLTSACLLMMVLQSCMDNQTVTSVRPDPAASLREAASTPPNVTQISSAAPCDNCTASTSLNVNWTNNPYLVTITGTGLASTTVAITDAATGKLVSDYSFQIKSWTDATVTMLAGTASTALPRTLKFTFTNSGLISVSKTVSATPLIQGKIYGSSPHYVNKKRIEKGLAPLPIGFGQRSGALNQDYQPKISDAWLLPDVNF